MARSAKLNVKSDSKKEAENGERIKRDGPNAELLKVYYLDVPAWLSETGTAKRPYFASKGEAEKEARELKKRIKEHGESAKLLSPHDAHEFMECRDVLKDCDPPIAVIDAVLAFNHAVETLNGSMALPDALEEWREARNILEGLPVSIVEAAKHYAAWYARQNQSVTFAAAFDAYLKKPLSVKYLRQIRTAKKHFSPFFEERMICDIIAPDLIQALEALNLSPASYNSYRRVLSAIFANAEINGWVERNPVEKIKPHKESSEETRTLSPIQCRALLESSPPEWLPYHVFCLFCGLRPTEAVRLRWESLELAHDSPQVFIKPGNHRKEGGGRLTPIFENALVWLKPLLKQTGNITPAADHAAVLKRIRRKADTWLITNGHKDQATLFDDWQQDCMRHTAASMMRFKESSMSEICRWLGHSENVHKKHYHKPLLPEIAREFWNLRPI